MTLLLLLLACPAEMLGIPVPEGGLDAISMDDLRRDTHQLTKGQAGTPQGAALREAFLAERFDQMHLERRGACGWRAGRGKAFAAVVAPEPEPGDRAGWARVAMVISASKAFDGRPPGALGVAFCVGEAPAGATEVLEPPEPGLTDGDVDFRPLVTETKALASRLEELGAS